MKINIEYDSSVQNAPSGFATAVTEAVNYLDNLIADNVTITIDFGWGAAGPLTLNSSGSAVAVSGPAYGYIYQPTVASAQPVEAALEAAYARNGLSGVLTSSVLNADFATVTNYRWLGVAYAQLLALGLSSPSVSAEAQTGYVVLNPTYTYNFDVNGPTDPGAFGAVAALLHEITHDLGRTAGFGAVGGQVETLLDLFRYSSPGVLQTTPGDGRFSLDGKTLYYQFQPASSDAADWTGVVDANGYALFGNGYHFSAVDKLELEALGFALSTPVAPFTPVPGVALRDNFNGDGVSDVLIAQSGGAVDVGELGGSGRIAFVQVGALGPEWAFVGAGDLQGDGRTDFLIENSHGAVDLGEVAGGRAAYSQVAALGPEWRFHGTGDFLGAGSDQFLIENDRGAVVVGQVVGGRAQYAQVGGLGPEWSFEGTGGFLGDGRSAFLIENASGGVVAGEVTGGAAAYTRVAALGPEWRFVAVGDFLGHGKSDFLIENASGAVVVGEVTNGVAAYTRVGGLGHEWTFVGAGDYAGSGVDSFLIENASGEIYAGTVVNGAAQYAQLGQLGADWHFHG